MNRNLVLAAALLAASPRAAAQTTVLYQQDFGTGNGTTLKLADVGWTAVHDPGAPVGWDGIYVEANAHDGDTTEPLPVNTLYFGANAASSGIFYTTTGLGSGPSGNSAFASIDPTQHTNLNLAVWCQWSWQGANLANWFAVQVGGAWYVCTNQPLTTAQHSAGAAFHRSSISYNPAASNWNLLTVTGSSVAVGDPAPAALSGSLTGVGVVVRQSAGGSWNYSNFQITSVSNSVVLPPTLVAAPINQGSYEGGGASFAVKASGTEPFTYSWHKGGVPLVNGGNIAGADTPLLTLTNLTAADVDSYSVMVSNAAGAFDTSLSGPAMLLVDPVPDLCLYAETFPFVGALAVGYPVSVIGWSNAIADNLSRLYQIAGGDGAAYAFEAAASTRAFYVTTESDRGSSGLPFRGITPSAHPAVSFSVDLAPSYQPANVAAHVAVQMGGGSWYVNATPLPVDTSIATQTFTTYRQQFDPLAAQWNTLTIGATSASIGAPVAADLAGEITGAGLVFGFTGAGTFNFDNFLVTTDAVPPTAPTITSSPWSQTVYAGAGVSFAVNATGTRPFVYRWEKDGAPLANGDRVFGADSSALTILGATPGDAGQYAVTVSNAAGSDSSANYVTTMLTVTELPIGMLYAEAFPYVGPGTGGYPLSAIGWQNALPNNPDRLFQNAGGDGAAYAYQNGVATTAFFVTPTFDPGTSGLPFPSLDLAFWPSLTFSVDIAPAFTPANVTAAIAVQMNGGPWYVSSADLPVDTSFETTAYSTHTQVFEPQAARWRNLTLVAGSGATIGGAASDDLDGTITGAGLVFTHAGSGGTFNFDNFQITGAGIGGLVVEAASDTAVALSWVGHPGVRLQSATHLDPSATLWVDVPNTAGASRATVPNPGPRMFFRLIQK